MRRVTRRRAEAVYAPLRAILAEIERTGCVDSVGGRPCFKCSDGWYETAPAIGGIVDYLDIAADRHGWQINTRPLEVIGLRLAANAPITPEDIAKARQTIKEAVEYSIRLSVAEAADILRTVQIRHQLEATK